MIPQSKRISQLDLAAPLTGSEQLALVQDGRTVRAPLSGAQSLFANGCQCTLVSRHTTVGTDGNTLEKYLQTWQMPANTLTVDGSWLEIYAYGGCANNSNVKTIRMRFGATILNAQSVAAPNNVGWFIKATVIRIGDNSQKGLTVSEPTIHTGGTDGTMPTEDLLSDIPISISGQNGTASTNDITCEGFIIRLNLLDPNS